MKKSTKTLLYLLIPAVLIVAFFVRNLIVNTDDSSGGSIPTTTQESRDNRLSVNGVVARPESFSERILTTGSIIANEEVWLRPETSGRITELNIREGTAVSKGDVLVKINDADLRAELLRANLQLELAQIRETRQKALLENRAIAEEDYEVALNQVKTLQAEIDLIQARIDKTELLAPFNGVIGLRNVSPGSYITPSDIIASLQDYSRVRIDFSIPERYTGRIQVADRIRFTRQGSDETYDGRIIAIEPRIDAATRTLQLRAQAANPNQLIIPGAFVEIQLELRDIPDAILIPSEAVIPELGGHSLFVSRDGRAHRLSVSTGVRTETRVQITDGLSPGDTVLTTGILQLRGDLPIRFSQVD